MATVVSFTFNPFLENTYLVYDETKEAVLFDPGCYKRSEQEILDNFIEKEGLKLVHLVNTHCHLDHIFGNKYISEKYDLPLIIHEAEIPVLQSAPMAAQMYGVTMEKSPDATQFLKEGDTLQFGNTTFEVLFTPGHSPGSISFYCAADDFIIAGDVLFQGSIGRTDLPGGDHETLIRSIKEKFLPLEDQVRVFSGHGPVTTIGAERVGNPFLV